MLELDADNAAEYLRTSNAIAKDVPVEITRLTGGVSNEVLYVEFPRHQQPDFVLKQARERLRVPEAWHCSVTRIWREVDVLRICESLLGDPNTAATGADDERTRTLRTPRLLFEDRDNYCFAMSAAPREHVVWKRDLLRGKVDPSIATACGRMLGQLHSGSWNDPAIEAQLADRTIFDALRLDPYFRFTAARCPDVAHHFQRLVSDTWQHRHALVHADFSPKNLLVYDGGLLMVDFETGHFGDPAFDIGFFLSHLLLKAFNAAPRYESILELMSAFWESYAPILLNRVDEATYRELVIRGIQCLAGCAWARLDGKSGIDYLDNAECRQRVRALCLLLFVDRPPTWPIAETMCRDALTRC